MFYFLIGTFGRHDAKCERPCRVNGMTEDLRLGDC